MTNLSFKYSFTSFTTFMNVRTFYVFILLDSFFLIYFRVTTKLDPTVMSTYHHSSLNCQSLKQQSS